MKVWVKFCFYNFQKKKRSAYHRSLPLTSYEAVVAAVDDCNFVVVVAAESWVAAVESWFVVAAVESSVVVAVVAAVAVLRFWQCSDFRIHLTSPKNFRCCYCPHRQSEEKKVKNEKSIRNLI